MRLSWDGVPSLRSVLLTVTLMLIAGLSGWAVWSTRQAAGGVARIDHVADAFQRVMWAIDNEEGLRLRYGFVPGEAVRSELDRPHSILDAALQDVQHDGDADARTTVADLSAAHVQYLASLDELFAALDSGDEGRAGVSAAQSEDLATAISNTAAAAAAHYHAIATGSLDRLGASRAHIVSASLAVLACAMAVLSLLLAVLIPSLRGSARDSLTGLRNHRSFQEALRPSVEAAARRGQAVALAKIDLDDFQEANDQHGHARGDQLLVQFATLLGRVRGGNPLFRTGGDDFAIILRGYDGVAAKRRVERMRLHIRGRLPWLPFSAGIAGRLPGRGDADQLLGEAEAALAAAKRLGKNQFTLFDDVGGDSPPLIRSAKVRAVRRLLAERRVTTAFQPIWSLECGRILAFEALSRPAAGYDLDGPLEAFTVAERFGLTDELDALCRRAALSRAREIPRGALLFLNVSPQVLDRGLLRGGPLARAVLAAGIRPERVVLEVTERNVPRLPVVVREAKALREYGFKLALDDVGAGNSGLEMLRQLPVDFVKIDREVVAGALTNITARAVFAAIAAFARESRSVVIAEGIENEAMLDFARRGGAHAVQGYLLGHPSEIIPTIDDLTSERRRFAVPYTRPVPFTPVRQAAG